MTVADFFTCSIALFAVLQYERAFNNVLHPVNPFWKFWGVKGLLSVNFLQGTVLAIVSWATANDDTGFVATLLKLGSQGQRWKPVFFFGRNLKLPGKLGRTTKAGNWLSFFWCMILVELMSVESLLKHLPIGSSI